jgi:peptidyl-prolyl cis-trans isomerase A (cyclophilin A)
MRLSARFWSAAALLVVSCFVMVSAVSAATVVKVASSLGEYRIELYEDLAPNTVARFLSDVEAGSYHFTMIHYAASTYFVGGRYRYESCAQGPIDTTPAISAISTEETNLANSPGTLAMVRDSNNPDLITGEWLINLGNNIPADPSVAPVVIGEIIEGYGNADSVLDQWQVPMDGASPSVPTLNYEGFFSVQCGSFGRDNLIFVSMEVESVDSDTPANYFDAETGLLHVTADAAEAGLLSLSFSLAATEPEVIIQAMPESLSFLSETVPAIGSFDLATNTLTLPELVVDGQVAFRDLVFTLSDEANLQFTLQSFSQ